MRSSKLTTVAFLLAGSALLAQSAHTGAINGLVKDPVGKPIPGAAVIARSGQIERRVTASENGTFRLSLLNAGKWELTVTRAGMQTRTAHVQVKINDTQTANIQMAPIAEATVVVVDATKTMDVTSANVTTSVAAETLNKIPTDRTSVNALDGLMSVTPGVQSVPGGGEYYVRGALGHQNSLNIDGTNANQTMSGGFISNARLGSAQPPTEFLESVEVVTGAFGAEYGSLGGVVNALTKSGSNEWSGQLFYNMNFPHSEAAAKFNTSMTPPQTAPAISDQYYRYGASVSGPILRDKLFFFLGYQGFKDTIPPALSGTNWNGLTSSTKRVEGPNGVNAKLNWFVNSDNQLILSFGHSKTKLNYGHQYPNDPVAVGILDSGIINTSTIQTSNLTWNWLASPDLYIVTSIANYQNPSRTTPTGYANGTMTNVTVNDYRYFLTGPGRNATNKPTDFELVSYITGSNASTATYTTNPNRQYRTDLTWQAGSHQIKAGYLQQRTTFHSTLYGAQNWSLYNETANYSSFEVTDLEMTSTSPMDNRYRGKLETYYVKDVVEVIPGLRLDMGVRYDPFKYWGDSGSFSGIELANFASLKKQLQPRVGLIWDVDQNGKKKVFAHWGRFFDNFSMNYVTWATTAAFKMSAWAEGSGYQYNPDYQGNGPVFTLVDPNPYTTIEFGYEGKPSPRAQNLKLPHKDTLTLGGDWNYNEKLSFGAVWTMWDMKDVVEDSWFLNPNGSLALPTTTNPDGSILGAVNQKVLWNPGPGTVTILDADGNTRTWSSNFPDPKNRYIGLNLHGQFSANNFFINVNYDWAHQYGNVGGGVPNNLSTFVGNAELDSFQQGTTKDFDFATSIANGNNEAMPVHVFRFNGGYTLQLGGHRIEVAPSLTWQSGLGLSAWINSGYRYKLTPQDRVFKGDTETPVLIDNQRCNMGRLPSSIITDLSLQDSFKVRGIQIVASVSIMNIFNTRPITGRETLLDEGRTQAESIPYVNYGMVSSWHAGRSVTAGVSMQF